MRSYVPDLSAGYPLGPPADDQLLSGSSKGVPWYRAVGFRTLAETVAALIVVVDQDGQCTYLNSAVQRYSGRSHADLARQGLLRLASGADRKRVLRAWARAKNENTSFEVDCRLGSRSGEFRWHLLRGMPVRSRAGGPLHWVVSCSDVHALRVAIAEAQDATELLKLVGASTDALVYAKDGQGKIVYANEATLRVLGVDADEIVGRPPVPHPARPWELLAINTNDARVVKEGKLLVAEERWTGSNGKERVFRSVKGPWARADGSVGVIGLTTDVTAEKAIQERTSHQRDLVQSVFENVPVVLWLTDDKGRIILRNNVWTSYAGGPPGEQDFSFRELIHPGDLETFLARWDATVEAGDLLECDVRVLDSLEGNSCPHRITLIPVRSSQGLITGWIGSAISLRIQDRSS